MEQVVLPNWESRSADFSVDFDRAEVNKTPYALARRLFRQMHCPKRVDRVKRRAIRHLRVKLMHVGSQVHDNLTIPQSRLPVGCVINIPNDYRLAIWG